MKSEDLGKTLFSMYKAASAPMSKKALDLEGVKGWFANLSPGAKSALIAALGGAGVGAAAHMLTPKDEDEDTRSRLLSNILSGAALGGIAGYGGNILVNAARNGLDAVTPTPDKDKGWWQRNAPELTYGRAAIGAGLGTGALAGGAAMNTHRINGGLARLGAKSEAGEGAIRALVSGKGGWNESAISASKGLQKARGAYNRATTLGLKNRLLQLIPNWKRIVPENLRAAGESARGLQFARDKELMEALVSAKGGTPLGDDVMEQLVKSRVANPRKIIRAFKARKVPKGKLALLSALLLAAGGGYQAYASGKGK